MVTPRTCRSVICIFRPVRDRSITAACRKVISVDALSSVVDFPLMALTTGLVPLMLAAGVKIAARAVEPGFTSLFNGTDFTGWKIAGPAETFTIQDGAIVAKGATSHCYYDGSFRNHSFRNFELKVDVMTRAGSNGGGYDLTAFQGAGG